MRSACPSLYYASHAFPSESSIHRNSQILPTSASGLLSRDAPLMSIATRRSGLCIFRIQRVLHETVAAPYSLDLIGREGPASVRSSILIIQSAAPAIIAAAAPNT